MGVPPPMSGRLTPLAVARERLFALARAPRVETVALRDALGRVAAADLVVPHDRPETDLALDDGWAVAAADTVGASPYAPAFLVEVEPIAHGAALPFAADAVLPTVCGRADGGMLVVETTLAPGENTRRRGADLPAGTVLAGAGRSIDAFAVALAALAGIETVEVATAIVALRAEPTSPLADLAAAVLTEMGCRIDRDVVGAGLGPETTLAIVIGASEPSEDAAEITGLAVTGLERARLSPRGEVPVITLPDRLEAVALALETLIVPTLTRRLDLPDDRGGETRPLARKLASRVGFTEVALLDVDAAGCWLPLAVGDLAWSAWARARALVELPPESEGVPEGSTLTARRPRVRIRPDRSVRS